MAGKTSQKQLEYARKYHKGYDDIKIRVVHGERDVYKDYATSHGWNSLNACVCNIMEYVIANKLTASDFQIKP